VAEQVAAGALTAEEARVHPRRNILTRALGTGQAIQVDTGTIPLEEKDTLLLCSDGLYGLVEDQEIAKTLSQQEPRLAAQKLVEQANARGGHDNVTVVVARVDRLGADGGESLTQQDLLQRTTLEIPAVRRRRGRIFPLVFRVAASPLKIPWWMAKKFVRR